MGNSKIYLEIGDITLSKVKIFFLSIFLNIKQFFQIKSSVIVNTTNSRLSLNTGVLSKAILKAAGDSILNECKLAYPNGIQANQVASTSAGNIQGVTCLFHVPLPYFENTFISASVFIYI